VLTGPHNFNSEEIVQLLMDAGAAFIVNDTEQLAHSIAGLLETAELRTVMGAAGKAVLDANRGALDRLLTLVDPLLE
jgi:3-deoxy-D-manno-octulosonic-acid transferase